MDITSEWDGDDVISQLQGAVSRLSDTTSLLQSIGVQVTGSMQANINESRTPDGVSYRPLVRFPSRKPLLDTGALYSSIHYNLSGPDTVTIGHGKQYGIFQDQGTSHIPARQFVGLRADDLSAENALVSSFVTNAFGDSSSGFISAL